MTTLIKNCRLNLKTTESFRAWLAGLIDGEGNFYIFQNSNRVSPRIRIVLQESGKFVLKYIQNTIGGFLTKRKKQMKF